MEENESISLPQPDGFPVSEAFLGVTDNSQMRGVTELYFPSRFAEIVCSVRRFELELKSLFSANLRIEFELEGSQDVVDNLYQDESWKYMATSNFLKYLRPSEKPRSPVPVFALMLNKSLRVNNATLSIGGSSEPVLFDQSPDILILPDSYPPVKELPEDKSYSYYDKKSAAFYADLIMGQKYYLDIELDSNFSFELAPLWPYGSVHFQDAQISVGCQSDFSINAACGAVQPIRERNLPSWLEEKLERSRSLSPSPPTMPNIAPAHYFRGSIPLFLPDELTNLIGPSEPEKDIFTLSELKNRDLSNFQSFRLMIMTVFPPGKKYDVTIRRREHPLPPRVYEQIQSLPGYQDILVEYDILNLTKEKQFLQIETEIDGYTTKTIESHTVIGMDNDEKKPARVRISHCPRLRRDVLQTLASSENATLQCKVIDKTTSDVIFEQSYPIRFLGNDEIIWEIKDATNSQTYNLRSFVCAWIKPVDQGGLMDEVRSKARQYHPDHAFGHKIDSLPAIESHAKALYDCLASEYGMGYLNQPFSSKGIDISQRVVLPDQVVRNKAGNCIDLTILFASLLEGVGIYSLILIMPGHAFIGWGNPRITDEMSFLEITYIGSGTFEEAQAKGLETFKEQFLYIGADNPLPPAMTAMKGCHIIDTKSVYQSGVITRS